jgi:hypothetical protein
VKDYIIALDLGQAQDFSAMVVLNRVWWRKGENPRKDPPRLWHTIPTIVRWPLTTIYPRIVEDVYETYRLFEDTMAQWGVALVVDAGGPGKPVIDLLRAKGLKPIGVTITAGNLAHEREDGSLTVPKRDMCTALVVAAQSGQIGVAKDLPLAKDFHKEVASFGYTVNKKTGNMSYESIVSEVHDDMVAAAGLGLWYSTTRLPKSFPQSGGGTIEDTDYAGAWN